MKHRQAIVSAIFEKGAFTPSSWLGAPTHRTATVVGGWWVSACARVGACVCVRTCMRACERARVMCLQYTKMLFDPGL